MEVYILKLGLNHVKNVYLVVLSSLFRCGVFGLVGVN